MRLAPLLVLLALCSSPVYAETAPETLSTAAAHALDGMAPAGHWAARLTLLRNGYDQRYDNDGHRVDLSGMAGLDTSVVTEYSELMLGYGVTEDLTVGAIIPWARTRTKVGFAPGAEAGLQALATGFNYKPLRTSTASGLGDPTVGALWRFHKGQHDSAILGVGVRFGVSPDDDPDNLLDVPPGDGSTDLRTRLEYFRDLGSGFDLRLLAEYQIQSADKVTARTSLTSLTNETLKRDLGDYWEYDIELGKSFGDWRVSATWHRYQEPSDRYTTLAGAPVAALMANTDTVADQYRLAVTWSGVNAWRAGKLPMPLIVKLEMQDAFDGRNFVDVRDVYLRVTSLF
jgi:hypothetical protein